MNTQKIIIYLMIISVLILSLIVIMIFRRRKIELNQGEIEVNEVLEKIKGYKLLSNVMIKRESGTSQIDHILIGKKGVFVIETKDYNGKIYGDQYSKYWMQKLNGRKNTFYNPIRQNYGHIKALEEMLDRKDIFISLIVFTNKSNIKKIKVEVPVIQLKKLKRFIKKYKSDIYLSKDEISEIYNSINKKNIISNRAIKKHVKKLKKTLY
ncbi:nuclease-related domain-containing protein [Caproiciproducens sp. MSJ-32]|uniref:nuclease-related domain-containing protein n=1 Tax=Caproiciproducens sp. MSJ-32 TaxID=2841527 RepID=UPI001C11AD69|nr:nuclease-related domain-containing protein [Caproiciproducens sp. MSJ-32]MBU5456057.1 NERD domain-containing protein [Caproiciproducens sp. MSJ-32]